MVVCADAAGSTKAPQSQGMTEKYVRIQQGLVRAAARCGTLRLKLLLSCCFGEFKFLTFELLSLLELPARAARDRTVSAIDSNSGCWTPCQRV